MACGYMLARAQDSDREAASLYPLTTMPLPLVRAKENLPVPNEFRETQLLEATSLELVTPNS